MNRKRLKDIEEKYKRLNDYYIAKNKAYEELKYENTVLYSVPSGLKNLTKRIVDLESKNKAFQVFKDDANEMFDNVNSDISSLKDRIYKRPGLIAGFGRMMDEAINDCYDNDREEYRIPPIFKPKETNQEWAERHDKSLNTLKLLRYLEKRRYSISNIPPSFFKENELEMIEGLIELCNEKLK